MSIDERGEQLNQAIAAMLDSLGPGALGRVGMVIEAQHGGTVRCAILGNQAVAPLASFVEQIVNVGIAHIELEAYEVEAEEPLVHGTVIDC